MKKQYLLGSFIISALLVPVLASAATADEIQAQIQSLLNQVTALQAQLNTLTTDTSVTTAASSNFCPNLYRTLSRGSRGSDVISLQQFLIARGLLSSDSATGFFGPMTESAVQRWQAQNSIVSNGSATSTGYGVVGARTRATIATKCTTTSFPVQPSSVRFSASPMSGQAPLGVTFTTNVSGASINFGDGSSALVESNCFYGSSGCTIGSYSTYHLYQSPGTYTATLSQAGSCSSGYCAQTASAMITVTGKQTIAPPTITSLQPAAGAVGTTVTIKGSGFATSNSIYLNDTFVETQNNSNGSILASITFVIPVGFGEVCYSDGRGCSVKVVNPGNYTISVRNANGTSNSVAFTVTGGQTITLPTISSLSPTSGPVSFTNVTITGTGFTSTGNDVHFGPVGGIKNLSSNGTSLTFTVPLAVTACDFSADPQSCTTAQIINIGDYQVYVQNSNGTSNATTFTVTGGQTI